ncbi:hypothetical protein RCL_jg984.t1 [Rhizophagus clarus]|uniref:Uncharacterized protein n=1 Tax=Rhizophagus clarus TaxID=94130 RepID=A0A8H3M4M9_9GLOM|nr:hypothetical protein RCL_jg984.t1 [Rhizophagus clarus]
MKIKEINEFTQYKLYKHIEGDTVIMDLQTDCKKYQGDYNLLFARVMQVDGAKYLEATFPNKDDQLKTLNLDKFNSTRHHVGNAEEIEALKQEYNRVNASCSTRLEEEQKEDAEPNEFNKQKIIRYIEPNLTLKVQSSNKCI